FTNDTISAMQPIAARNSNTLSVDLAPDIGSIYTDTNKLKQSLLNLLDNACKFTQNGQIRLAVKIETRNNNDWVQFTVSDTGIGISDEHTRHLFSEFTQADSSTTKSYEGTGLGLSLSQRFCELMGGHITFTSKLGEGSIFSISIPRHVEMKSSVTYSHNSNTSGDYPKSA
ncbi:ATP-binding protein, partial [Kaarinaea lacus]